MHQTEVSHLIYLHRVASIRRTPERVRRVLVVVVGAAGRGALGGRGLLLAGAREQLGGRVGRQGLEVVVGRSIHFEGLKLVI